MFNSLTTTKQSVYRNQVMPADKLTGLTTFSKDRGTLAGSVFPPDRYVTPQSPAYGDQVMPADKLTGLTTFSKDRGSLAGSVFPPDHYVTPDTDAGAAAVVLPLFQSEDDERFDRAA